MATIGKNLQREPIPSEDSSSTVDAIINDTNTAIAINYSPYLERIANSLEIIADTVSNDGIIFKDRYAALSYASLIKVFEEEGIDIDALIAKTNNKLQGL